MIITLKKFDHDRVLINPTGFIRYGSNSWIFISQYMMLLGRKFDFWNLENYCECAGFLILRQSKLTLLL